MSYNLESIFNLSVESVAFFITSKLIRLENTQHVYPSESDIVVDGEDEHECKEDPRSTKKVPDVVSVKEIEEKTFPVQLP